MNPTYDFTGQVVLVTGAGAGMGLATARAFAESGAAVALTDIDEAALNTAATNLTDVGHRVLVVTCDVSDEDQVAAAVDRTVETFGRLDMANRRRKQCGPSNSATRAMSCSSRLFSSRRPASGRWCALGGWCCLGQCSAAR
ncbi:SDR family NAD(P)-dependent oxidoreductase [Streptomyces coeruleorubidus]|uniref:SDR family NAD(P)-dependent oxidoreductase n=1 Tax=Streptomyces coeruleorubidus TaxID=116188 RepID=UPI00378D9806